MEPVKQHMPEDAVFICTVGGSPEPIIHSIDQNRPSHVIFVPSAATLKDVQAVQRGITWNGIDSTQTCIMSDPQSLPDCVAEIRAGVLEALKIWVLPKDTLFVADITGGTKPMVAALTLVMMEHNSRFTYVGGTRRSKDGVGIVESGSEELLEMPNPWAEMGLREARRLVQSFNYGQYRDALAAAKELEEKNTQYGKFYGGISALAMAYMAWDIFDYGRALALFQNAEGQLKPYLNRRYPAFCEMYSQFAASRNILEDVARQAASLGQDKFPEGGADAYLRDLLANTKRCAALGHYDDAVARLYCIVEKTAKLALMAKGKNNSKLTEADLAEAGGDFVKKYAEELAERGFAQLPRAASLAYLGALEPGHPVVAAFTRRQKELEAALEARNKSLLAHGYNPVQQKHYEKLYRLALEFLEVDENDLHQFPALKLGALPL